MFGACRLMRYTNQLQRVIVTYIRVQLVAAATSYRRVMHHFEI